jgi:hypothetical protein
VITYQDCVRFSGLSEDEIAAIAEHEHLPEMVAVELGQYLLHTRNGLPTIRRIIRDDICRAEARGDFRHAMKLRAVLDRFARHHPGLRSA